MRWLSRLLVVLVVCFVATALPAGPARAADGAWIRLSPGQAVPGKEVTVYGGNFTPNQWVDVYYYMDATDDIRMAEVKTEPDGDFEVSFTVPESYKGDHKVRAEMSSTIYAEALFAVKPGLTVSPREGPVGTNVTVEGLGFAGDEEGIEIHFDAEVLAANVPPADENGSWEMSFLIPRCAQGRHQIDATGDSSTLAQVEDATFDVTPGMSLGESSGSPGESIIVIGSGFAARERDIRILFDGEETNTDPEIIRADDTGYWQATFDVPERPKGTYSVTAEGEWTPREDIAAVSFEVRPGLVLSPEGGHVGTELTVTGGGFPANKAVVIWYEDSQIGAAETGSAGGFEVGIVVPESPHGQHEVTAEDSAANIATAFFTMESDPPDRPDPISPDDGDRAGFIGRVRPTFEWSAVSDDSGVSYNLQIAHSSNSTASGFANPVISVTGIVGTNYTLERTEALSYGTYYWIVQAVDGADNHSGWTAARSFHAGRLPLWAFVLIIVAAVAGIGTAIYFFVIRRRVYYL